MTKVYQYEKLGEYKDQPGRSHVISVWALHGPDEKPGSSAEFLATVPAGKEAEAAEWLRLRNENAARAYPQNELGPRPF